MKGLSVDNYTFLHRPNYMSKQSVEQILKDVIESSNAKTVALTEQLKKLAGANSNYTDRLEKMEENLTSAMQKVLEMDSNIKDFHKAFGNKVEDMEAKFASWWKNNEEDMEKPENWDDMDDEERNEWIESNAKKEVAKVSKKAENVIDGVNPKVVTGQPKHEESEEEVDVEEEINKTTSETQYKAGKKGKKGEMPQFIKDKIEEREEEDAEESAEDCEEKVPVSKKGKKAGKLKIEHEGEIEVENESEESEDGEEEEVVTTAKKGKKGEMPQFIKDKIEEREEEEANEEEEEAPKSKKGKKALENDVVKPDNREITAEPLDEDATEQVEKVEEKLSKKAKKATFEVPGIKQGEPVETTEELDEDASEKQDELEHSVAKKAKKAKRASVEDSGNVEDGDEVGNAPAVNHKYEEETEEALEEEKHKARKGKKAEDGGSHAVADVTRLVESVSGKIEAAYERLASATIKQASAETRVSANQAEITALTARAERGEREANAALEAAKSLAMEVKLRDDTSAAVKALEKRLAEMTDKLAALEVADKSAEMKAAKMVASTGISEPVETSPGQSKDETDTEIFKRFESMTGKEQRAYYIANKAIIERVAFQNTKHNRFR